MSWVLSNWLWLVWAAMAIVAAVGFIQVRRQLNRVEKTDDVSPQRVNTTRLNTESAR